MKRIGNLKEKICTLDNIYLADENARLNKTKKYGIQKHDKNRDIENQALLLDFINLSYKTSLYSTFKIYEPKERIIYRLPYYPDRIAHHAIMNIMEGIWKRVFIKNTYSSIRGRGIHKCANDLYNDLQNDVQKTKYCLKLDVRKFYPSINHDILYSIILKKIKDKWLLKLLKGIIDSAKGVPIGNYLSQFFANLYLAYFDHWIKEDVKCKYYYRYADDIVILDNNKNHLKNILIAIKFYFHNILKLEIKSNYQVFPIESRGIDFVGYVFRHKYRLLRKSIKTKISKLVYRYINNKISKDVFESRMTSYRGWLKFCNSKHFSDIVLHSTKYRLSTWNGELKHITSLNNVRFYIVEIIIRLKYFEIHAIRNRVPFVVRSKNKWLYKTLNKRHLPYSFKYEHSKFQYKTKRHRTTRQ